MFQRPKISPLLQRYQNINPLKNSLENVCFSFSSTWCASKGRLCNLRSHSAGCKTVVLTHEIVGIPATAAIGESLALLSFYIVVVSCIMSTAKSSIGRELAPVRRTCDNRQVSRSAQHRRGIISVDGAFCEALLLSGESVAIPVAPAEPKVVAASRLGVV